MQNKTQPTAKNTQMHSTLNRALLASLFRNFLTFQAVSQYKYGQISLSRLTRNQATDGAYETEGSFVIFSSNRTGAGRWQEPRERTMNNMNSERPKHTILCIRKSIGINERFCQSFGISLQTSKNKTNIPASFV